MADRGRRRLGRLRRTLGHHLSGRTSRFTAALSSLLLVGVLCAPSSQAAPLADEYWFPLFQISKVWTVTHGAGITVAVLDTGVPITGDLIGRVLPGADFVQPGGGDGTRDPGQADEANYSHGDHMAMLIAGTGARTGFTGLAPAAKILPVRVITDQRSEGVNTAPAIVSGIRYAVAHGAKIINMSLGDATACPSTVQAAVEYAYQHNVIVVAASGNAGSSSVDAPSSCYGALSIGSVDKSFARWTDSNYGAGLDFVTPGVNHPIPLPGGRIIPSSEHNSGTSESTALMSGILALVWSHFPTESARQIVTRVLWHVHNGLGGSVFAKRISDQLGYGQPLPYFALTENTPANAANPIYDAADKYFGTTAKPTTSAAKPGTSAKATATATATKSGGGSGALIPVVIVVVLLLAAAGLVLARRKRA